MRTYTLLLPVIFLLSCEKKDNNDTPPVSTCPIELDQIASISNEGPRTSGTVSTLSYDSQNRIVRVDYNPEGTFMDIQYPGKGIVTYRLANTGTTLSGLIRYDAVGDFVFHGRVWTGSGGDTLDHIEDHFSYDADRQRKSYRQIAFSRQGTMLVADTVEVFEYTWMNGNMVSAATKRYGNITYDYYPGTDGSFFDNTPAEMTLHYLTAPMYPFAAAFGQPKRSKWLLKTISGVLGGRRFEYDTDAHGRVVTKRAFLVETSGPDTYQETYTYKWRCE